ncbi:UbiA family prenyltransferase [Oceanicoccus sp. KOV_DT_Chl]|uniref:UbiA family prenyltransferase n=1 Tax=Oceanicoccus sp. KOV_DT_Chl TaxID=1904639 RepID=UPI000C7D0C43|nr:UbiA family prenyltransferase [Oceanicoccus sp. KOV_DT_Chl]
MTQAQQTPLCVDLDGTLIRSDVLLESILNIIIRKPYLLLLFPLWLSQGKARFKHKIAENAHINPAQLPYNEELLDYLHNQKQQGRSLILATASHSKPAAQIAAHLNIFDDIIASNTDTNMSGKNKLAEMTRRFGVKNFSYAGNASIDLNIWPHCQEAIVVNGNTQVRKNADKVANVVLEIGKQPSLLPQLFRATRVYQWPKNLLIFVNLAMAHQLGEGQLLLQTTLAFIAFCLCASSVYLTNDLCDLQADRQHDTKKDRPFASGKLSITWGFCLAPILLVSALALTAILPLMFTLALCAYYLVTLAYSFLLKKIAIIDVIVLAGLYTLRIVAGATIMGTFPSFWLMAFSMFLFMSLAVAKRYAELYSLQPSQAQNIQRRGYVYSDAETLSSLGITSGYMAILVLALYINSTAIVRLYTHPELIWLLCPILMYWISRIWLLARRGSLDQDPVLFAIRDTKSYLMAAIILLVIWFAR